jgi:hypothetical protein
MSSDTKPDETEDASDDLGDYCVHAGWLPMNAKQQAPRGECAHQL